MGGDFIEDLYWIWIARMKNLYFEVFDILIQKYGSIYNLWNLKIKDFIQFKGCTKRIIEDFCNIEYRKNLDKYVEYMKKENIKMITCFDDNYPVKLHFIKNKPIVLFYKGDIVNLNNESIAIVGSRNCSEYGKKCASFFSKELSKRCVNIISGLAMGIDSVAHIEAINCKGKTIAVIGNGLDAVYPKCNKILEQKIVEHNGLIISEYVIGTKPEKINFPRRNRIISGISNAVIVIEGSNKSGSLITANYAISQGKEVWAVPGNIFSKSSEGTNQLIKDGANVLTNLNDILR